MKEVCHVQFFKFLGPVLLESAAHCRGFLFYNIPLREHT